MRADEQHPAPAVTQARVGIQQVSGAVQGHHGLARTRAAVDDQSTGRSRADDGVLVGRDGGQHVPHPGRPAGAQAGDERRLVIQRGVPVQPARSEHLIPVVTDLAARPPVPAAAGQPHRAGVGRCEERLRRRGTPVHQQPAARAVGQPQPPDIHRLRAARADHPPQAQVQAEAAQGTQPGGQPVNLQVPLQRPLAHAARRPALGIQTAREVRDRLLEALRDSREVQLVAGDQRRVGLGSEALGKVKRADSQRVHVISSDLRPPERPRGRRLDWRSVTGAHTSVTTHAFRDSGSVASAPVTLGL